MNQDVLQQIAREQSVQGMFMLIAGLIVIFLLAFILLTLIEIRDEKRKKDVK